MAADQKPLVGPRSTRQQPPDVKKDWISSWMGERDAREALLGAVEFPDLRSICRRHAAPHLQAVASAWTYSASAAGAHACCMRTTLHSFEANHASRECRPGSRHSSLHAAFLTFSITTPQHTHATLKPFASQSRHLACRISTCLTYLSIPLAAAAAVGLASTAAPGALAAIQLAGLALQRVVLASYASPTRGELRQAEGIPGSAAADWALWCLLPQCMLCQEAAQLADWQQRGAAPRSSSCSSKGGALRAPLQQLVECHRQAHRERDAPRSPGGYAALHAGALPREQFVTAVSA